MINRNTNITFQLLSKGTLILLVILCIVSTSCKKKNNEPVERPRPGDETDSLVLLPEGSSVHEVSIKPGEKFQTMENFGASDCWSTQFVGKWPVSKTNVMADWLFSLDTTDNGQPLGIGLSSWRFNIGAGSAEQGENSGIADDWRRSQSFLGADGSYNWNKQAGQQRFLKAAADRGVEQFMGFANSPPVSITRNGKAFGSLENPENITSEKLEDYATFLVETMQGIHDQTGVWLDYISPVNESQWDWTQGSQEGCYMTNATLLTLLEILDQKLYSNNPNNSKLLITEAGEWSYLYGKGETTGNQIEFFYGPNSPVNNAQNLSRSVAGHSYHTTTPVSVMRNIRQQVHNKASGIDDLQVWSTEYCPLGNGDLQALGWDNWKKDLGMDVALYVSSIIYHDLNFAHVSAWQWWLAISPYNYPDGLIYVSKDKVNGTYADSKLMWTLGNYSRFIRPGDIRINTNYEVPELFISAFQSSSDSELVFVVSNSSAEELPLKFKVDGWESGNLRPYITSGSEKHKLLPLKSFNMASGFIIPPRSIITFILTH